MKIYPLFRPDVLFRWIGPSLAEEGNPNDIACEVFHPRLIWRKDATTAEDLESGMTPDGEHGDEIWAVECFYASSWFRKGAVARERRYSWPVFQGSAASLWWARRLLVGQKSTTSCSRRVGKLAEYRKICES